MSYGRFAQVYDTLMDDSLYPKWVAYVNRYLSGNETILELGCGTGRLGIELKRAGYEITGLDLSNEMLTLAEQHQQESGQSFPLIQADMRELSELDKKVDAIVSFCDSLCYLEKMSDIEKVFKEAYQSLNDSGILLFDVHSIFQMEEYTHFSFHEEMEGLVFMWNSFEGELPYSVEHELSFFEEQEEDTYKRSYELHKERTYPIEVYERMLKEAGFRNIEVLADFDQEVSETSKRWFFKAKK